MPAFPYESCFQRVDQEFVITHFAQRAAKGPKISRYFSTAREMIYLPGGPGVVSFNTVKRSHRSVPLIERDHALELRSTPAKASRPGS
jgi:hypothetical protein